jgi:hypothetical protein
MPVLQLASEVLESGKHLRSFNILAQKLLHLYGYHELSAEISLMAASYSVER